MDKFKKNFMESNDLNSWRNNKELRESNIGLKKDVEINGNILTWLFYWHFHSISCMIYMLK